MRARRRVFRSSLVAASCLSALALVAAGPGLRALTANEPALADQWGTSIIGAPTAWAAGATGRGTVIAVVDTGIDVNHEDLAGKIAGGINLLEPTKPPQDDNGHGTHVAGTAAATTGNGRGVTGVAPEAQLMPVKILGSSGSGTTVGEDAPSASDAIRWAADRGAHVINLSLSETEIGLGAAIPDFNSFKQAVRYAWGKGAICVISAGNDYFASSDFADEPALVVSATTRGDTKATYSNGVGSAKWGVAAPGGEGSGDGDDILSTYWVEGKSNQYAYLAGTSMAAPHVSGAVAVLRGLGLSPQEAVDRLLGTAKDLGSSGRDGTFGHGRIDLARAVEGLTGSAPATTTPPADTGGPATTSAPGRSASPTTRPAAAPRTSPAAPAAVAPPPEEPTTIAPVETPTSEPEATGEATAAGIPDDQLAAPAPQSTGSDDDTAPWLPIAIAATALAAVGWVAYGRRHLLRTPPSGS